MNRKTLSSLFLWLSLSLFLSVPAVSGAQEWGEILSAQSKTKIRADRSMKAGVTGELKAGEKIRADFLRDDWYAVFSLQEKNRDEGRALGYVHALNLTAPAALPEGREAVTVKNLTFKKEKNGRERVLIELSRFSPPKIFSIEGKNPRIVIDIEHVLSVRKGLTRIPADGRLVRQIRSARDRKTNVMRIVIDVQENMNYEVDQAFYQAENIYAVEIAEVNQNRAEGKAKTAGP